MSFLSAVGKDFKAVFSWLGSPKGQAVVVGAESAAEVIGTAAGIGLPIQKGIDLLNNWMTEAVKMQALAEAAGQSTGSGTQKATAALATMVPELTSYLQGQSLTSQQVTDKAKAINDQVVTLLTLLDAPAVPVVVVAPSA